MMHFKLVPVRVRPGLCKKKELMRTSSSRHRRKNATLAREGEGAILSCYRFNSGWVPSFRRRRDMAVRLAWMSGRKIRKK